MTYSKMLAVAIILLGCCDSIEAAAQPTALPTIDISARSASVSEASLSADNEILKNLDQSLPPAPAIQLAAQPIEVYTDCCVLGTESDLDPMYPPGTPFGLNGSIYPSTVTISLACLSSEDNYLSAEQWAERLGITASVTGRGLFWYEGLSYNGGACLITESEEWRHRPTIVTSWTKTIPNPIIPGTYTVTAHFAAYEDFPQSGCFGTVTQSKSCTVIIHPSDPAVLFADTDRDGLTDIDEVAYPSLSTSNAFTFGDGVLDSVRVRTNTAITNADFDGDGLNGSAEIAKCSSSFHADSDHDGVNDDVDTYPLDSSRSSAGTGTSGAPVVTLAMP